MSRSGHSVLAIPVPELEPFVRARWAHYDAAWVSRDPAFTHAHITALAPFLAAPTPADLAVVEQVAASTEPFAFRLDRIAEFANGCLHLPPEPAAPFDSLTRWLCEAFPHCPPYAGEFDAVPHLTLDRRSPSVAAADIRELLGELIPVDVRATRLELHWYEAGNCHVQHAWQLAE